MLRNKILPKVLSLMLASTLLFSACGTPKPAEATPAPAETKTAEATEAPATEAPKEGEATAAPATETASNFIADRTVDVQIFIDDAGVSMATDQKATEFTAELKKRTGMELNFMYTSGNSDLEVMTTAIASGSLPDLISFYLNDSSRPEFPILLKAAREGMFTDVVPLIKDTKVYSKYLGNDFLGTDAKTKVFQRPEFNGAAYIVPMNIPRKLYEYNPDKEYVGGMMMQKKIADAIGVDVKTVNTQDDLYELLKKVKAGAFKDDSGNDMTIMSPKYWGGSTDSIPMVTSNYNFGISSGFNITPEGKVLHEAETDYVYKQIDFFRKLLAEGLITPEFFTMDGTRSQEIANSGNAAIIGDVHNYVDVMKARDYVRINLNNVHGNKNMYTGGKSMYCGWAIPATAKNPEEIVKLLDYLATKEGKLLWEYGIEGEHYDMVNGMPVVKKEIIDRANAGESQELRDTGFNFGGRGMQAVGCIGKTDADNKEDFGEYEYAFSSVANEFEFARKIARDNIPPKIVFVDGLPAKAYLADLKELEPKLTPVIDTKFYGDMRVQAMFAKSEDEVKKIVEDFRAQLKAAGIEEFEAYLEKMYKDDPKSINFQKE